MGSSDEKVVAVIMVGGPTKGTRFRPLSLNIPKHLFPLAGSQWCITQFLLVKGSKPSSAAGNNVSKAWPSSVSSSFSFRSEERAAKRKEYFQRLEEKSNAREAQKMELQAKSKEKAEAELRKMRQTLGFKAKPMPDFNHEMSSTPTKIKKLPLTRPRSLKLGRRPNSSTGLETKSLPPKSPCPSVKSDSVRHGMDKRSRPPSRPATSQSKKNPDENAFPKSPELKG